MTMLKIKRLLAGGLAVAAGFAYYMLARFHFAVPCVFRMITGLKCPGCGVTHMLINMAQMNFADAFAANPALFILQPVIYYFVGKMYVCWVMDKNCKWNRIENIILYAVIISLIIFGIIRNVKGVVVV